MTNTAADSSPSLRPAQSSSSVLTQPSARLGRLLTTLLVLPAAGLLLTPFVLLATEAAGKPGTLMILVDKPAAAVQLALGLLLAVLFCTLPFCRLAGRPADCQAGDSGQALVTSAAAPLPDSEPAQRLAA
ncbi:MAG: hypothetical protein KJZ80_18540 [Hyphomicrobiaceae bacterium]|nr:hypothetical protein [Hyphomicrobiaceae bacterium]